MPAKKKKTVEVKVTSTKITTSYGVNYKTGLKGLNNVQISKEFEGDVDIEKCTEELAVLSDDILEKHKALEEEESEEEESGDDDDNDDDDDDDDDDD